MNNIESTLPDRSGKLRDWPKVIATADGLRSFLKNASPVEFTSGRRMPQPDLSTVPGLVKITQSPFADRDLAGLLGGTSSRSPRGIFDYRSLYATGGALMRVPGEVGNTIWTAPLFYVKNPYEKSVTGFTNANADGLLLKVSTYQTDPYYRELVNFINRLSRGMDHLVSLGRSVSGSLPVLVIPLQDCSRHMRVFMKQLVELALQESILRVFKMKARLNAASLYFSAYSAYVPESEDGREKGLGSVEYICGSTGLRLKLVMICDSTQSYRDEDFNFSFLASLGYYISAGSPLSDLTSNATSPFRDDDDQLWEENEEESVAVPVVARAVPVLPANGTAPVVAPLNVPPAFAEYGGSVAKVIKGIALSALFEAYMAKIDSFNTSTVASFVVVDGTGSDVIKALIKPYYDPLFPKHIGQPFTDALNAVALDFGCRNGTEGIIDDSGNKIVAHKGSRIFFESMANQLRIASIRADNMVCATNLFRWNFQGESIAIGQVSKNKPVVINPPAPVDLYPTDDL